MRASEIIPESDLDEGWKDWVAGAAIGAAALSGHGDAEAAKHKQQDKPAIVKQVKADPKLDKKLADIKKQVPFPVGRTSHDHGPAVVYWLPPA